MHGIWCWELRNPFYSPSSNFSQLVPPSRVVWVVCPVSEAFTFWVIQFEIPALQWDSGFFLLVCLLSHEACHKSDSLNFNVKCVPGSPPRSFSQFIWVFKSQVRSRVGGTSRLGNYSNKPLKKNSPLLLFLIGREISRFMYPNVSIQADKVSIYYCLSPQRVERILPLMPNTALTGVGKENRWRKENWWRNGNW